MRKKIPCKTTLEILKKLLTCTCEAQEPLAHLHETSFKCCTMLHLQQTETYEIELHLTPCKDRFIFCKISIIFLGHSFFKSLALKALDYLRWCGSPVSLTPPIRSISSGSNTPLSVASPSLFIHLKHRALSWNTKPSHKTNSTLMKHTALTWNTQPSHETHSTLMKQMAPSWKTQHFHETHNTHETYKHSWNTQHSH